jgi:hypothetical protein
VSAFDQTRHCFHALANCQRLFLEVDEMNGSLANGYCRVLSSPKDCVLGGFTDRDCSLLLM